MIWNPKEQNQQKDTGKTPYKPGGNPSPDLPPMAGPGVYPAPDLSGMNPGQPPVPPQEFYQPYPAGQPLPVQQVGGWNPPPLPGQTQMDLGSGRALKKEKKHSRPIELAIMAAAMAFLLFAILCFVSLFSLNSTLRTWVTPGRTNNTPPSNSFAVLSVVGDIQNYGSDRFGINNPSYHHAATMNYVQQLTEDSNNKGILLYMNTGGGAVYESDELYTALMTYKEETGRPVWAFMGNACASGGYYICMAADFLVATPNTTTGSIGVYIAFADTSGLYEKLGIETVLIKSGEHKAVGVSGVEVTDAQRAVYQSSIDEKYEQFLALVMDGRQMDEKTARKLADGRAYTGNQAYENGLVDALSDWDTTVELFGDETGATPFQPNFSNTTALGSLVSAVRSALPRGEAEAALEEASQISNGVPMYHVPGLVQE